LHYLLFVSAASDVDPSNVVGLGTTEPAVADKDAVEQTAREQPVEQPTVASVAETDKEDPAQVKARASTLTRDKEATRTPPPSSVAEEGDKVLTPPPAEEERAPTPALAEASTSKGSPSRGKGTLLPVTTASAPMLVANMFTFGASVGTAVPVTRSSPRPKRRQG